MLAAFVAGVVCILGMRLVGSTLFGAFGATWGPALAAIVVVLGLGLYYHWNLDAGQRGRGGDDLYYLGLLLTLVSLIYTLVASFGLDAGVVADRIEELIGGFGIALVSTVAGILGRILMQDESIEPGVGSYPEATRNVHRTAPGQAANDLTHQHHPEAAGNVRRTAPGRVASDFAREHQPDAAGTVHRLAAGRAASGLAREPESGLRGVTDEAQQLRRRLREASSAFIHFTRVTSSHAEHVRAHTGQLLETFNHRMNTAAEQALEITATAWRETADTMRNEGERLSAQASERSAQAIEHVEAASRALEQQAAATSVAVRQRLDMGAKEVAQASQRLVEASGSLQTLVQALDRARGDVSTLGDAAATAATGLEAVVARERATHRELAEGVTASLVTARQAFEETAAAMHVERKRWSEQLRDWRTTVDAVTEANGKASEMMAAFAGLAENARSSQLASSQAWREAAKQFAEATRLASAWRDGAEDFAEAARTLRDLSANCPPAVGHSGSSSGKELRHEGKLAMWRRMLGRVGAKLGITRTT